MDWSIAKEAFLCDPKALQCALWSGKTEVLPNKKKYAEATFRITAKVKVDDKLRVVQFIVHRHKNSNRNFLYHVALYE
jgi:hypothetical protein